MDDHAVKRLHASLDTFCRNINISFAILCIILIDNLCVTLRQVFGKLSMMALKTFLLEALLEQAVQIINSTTMQLNKLRLHNTFDSQLFTSSSTLTTNRFAHKQSLFRPPREETTDVQLCFASCVPFILLINYVIHVNFSL